MNKAKTSQSTAPIFQLRSLNFGYAENRPLLEGIDFSLWAGQSIGLIGSNGSGKTTFFRCVTGLNQPWSGEILFHGHPLKKERDFVELRKRVGFALQNGEDQLFFASVLEDVAFGPLNLGLSRQEAEERAANWLKRVGLEAFENCQTGSLSGGQQKLLALAGILAMEPEALLLDEPFNGLDPEARERVFNLLQENPAAKIVVSHETGLLRSLCPEIMRLENGRLKGD